MLFLGIIWGTFHGRLAQVTEGALNAAGEAVTLSITMLGIVVFWNGILEIGSRAGLVEQLSEKMRPALKFLFPDLPPDCEAARQICVNFIANILGLGWAATPAGLKAMKELEKVEEERRKEKVAKRTIHAVSKGTASNEMCTFLIINISSLQLIPVNMIAYRSQYGSRVPMAIVGPALVITLATTLVAVVFCRGKQGCGVLTRGKQDEETCERRVQNIKIPERELRIDGTPRGGRL